MRGEIEIKKHSLDAYENLLKEKEATWQKKIALISKKALRCHECDIGFINPLFF